MVSVVYAPVHLQVDSQPNVIHAYFRVVTISSLPAINNSLNIIVSNVLEKLGGLDKTCILFQQSTVMESQLHIIQTMWRDGSKPCCVRCTCDMCK